MMKMETKRNQLTEKWLVENFQGSRGENQSIPRQILFSMYLKFCEKTKILAVSRSYLGKEIKRLFPMVNKKRISEYGKAWYHYNNLQFRHNISAGNVDPSDCDKNGDRVSPLEYEIDTDVELKKADAVKSNFPKNNQNAHENSAACQSLTINSQGMELESKLSRRGDSHRNYDAKGIEGVEAQKNELLCGMNRSSSSLEESLGILEEKKEENLSEHNVYCRDLLLNEQHISDLFETDQIWKVTTILILYRHQCQKIINQLNGNKIKQLNVSIQRFTHHFPIILIDMLELPNAKLILLWSDCILLDKLSNILMQQIMQEYYDSTIIMLKFLRSTIEFWRYCLNSGPIKELPMKQAVFESFDYIVICMCEIEDIKQKIKRISNIEKKFKKFQARIKALEKLSLLVDESLNKFLPLGSRAMCQSDCQASSKILQTVRSLIVNISQSSHSKAALLQTGWIESIIEVTDQGFLEKESHSYLFENFTVALTWFNEFSCMLLQSLALDNNLQLLAELNFKYYFALLNLEFIRRTFYRIRDEVKLDIISLIRKRRSGLMRDEANVRAQQYKYFAD